MNNPKSWLNNPSDALIKILKPIENKFKILEIIFDGDKKSNRQEQHIEILKKELTLEIKLSRAKVFHDRFWIIDDRIGFMVGASINGFGGKHFFIPNGFFDMEDTNTLLKLYKRDTSSLN